jgi:regulation of enolase protein 1 (concanavalin A-like superfamily)
MIRPEGNITLGASMDGANKFSGYVHSLQFYDRSFTDSEVREAYVEPSNTEDVMNFDGELFLNTRVISPQLIELAVVDADGKQVESGLLTYKYVVREKQTNTENEAIDWEKINDSRTSSMILSTNGKANQKCVVQVTDDSGNFHKTLTVDIRMSENQFVHFYDQAEQAQDYVEKKGGWDGVMANLDEACQLSVRAENGTITLASANTNLNNNSKENGPILYKEVNGDFLAQIKVVAVDGQERRNTPAYNEGGLLVMDDTNLRRQEIIHIGVFPGYNCGNMLTHVGHGRPQFPRGNGWEYDPYLQIERVGDMFYVRTSLDGNIWSDMPGSPIHAPQMKNKALKVGIYQTTYSNNKSWVSFDEFNLWQKKVEE